MNIRVPLAEQPRVSIVILAYRNVVKLHQCLASIASSADSTPFETIVVANGASADVLNALGEVGGVRVLESRTNLGFSGGCNRGARYSRGEFVLFLNDDVEVTPGWLDTLVETADVHPETGAIGSRMMFTDGTLHEAGQIVWGDGSTTSVGRGLPRDTRRYRFLRQVDYCSAASLLVRASAWRAVGGMDRGFHPGYCEDVDLCFAIQEAGWKIFYQPRSLVWHHEGSSFGSLLRDFLMERNRSRLKARWAERLARHEPGPERPGACERALHMARGFPRRVLVTANRIPSVGDGWLDELVAELDFTRYAVVVAAWGQVDEKRATALEALGVEVVDESPERHISRPEILYDAIVLGPQLTRQAAFQDVVRRQQPHAAVLLAETTLAVGGSWQDAVAAAQLARQAGWLNGERTDPSGRA